LPKDGLDLLLNGQELQAISQDGTSRLTGSAPAKQLGFDIIVVCQQSSRDLLADNQDLPTEQPGFASRQSGLPAVHPDSLANNQDLPAGSQDIPTGRQDCRQISRDLPRSSSHQREKHSRTSMLSTINVYFIPFVPNFFLVRKVIYQNISTVLSFNVCHYKSTILIQIGQIHFFVGAFCQYTVCKKMTKITQTSDPAISDLLSLYCSA
jgi:hypothetical protein